MAGSDWFRIDHFAHGITRIGESGLGPLHAANIWLVRGRERALLIDAGTGLVPLRPVVEALTALPVVCLVSHAHYDHMGGAWEFADRRAHRLEAPILADPTPDRTLWRGWLTDGSFSRRPAPGFRMDTYGLRPAPPTALLDEGASIDLGGRRLEILHVPGHSPGLLAVHDTTHDALFTSDALYRGRMFFDLPGSDAGAAARSVDRLVARGAGVIHPGHGPSLERAETAAVAAAAHRAISAQRTTPGA